MDSSIFGSLAHHYETLLDHDLIYYMYVAYNMYDFDHVPKGVKKGIKRYIFSKRMRKGISSPYNFTNHHLLPKCYFPDREFDPENCIPFEDSMHKGLHVEYSNKELILDPIMPIINMLEISLLNSK